MIASTTTQPGGLRLRLAGALDAAGATALRPSFERLGEEARQDVVLDLAEVTHLDGAGIGAVAYLFRRLAAQGRRLCLEGARGQPLALLREVGLARTLGLEAPARAGWIFGKGMAWAR
jgi:anti-anti-sigma factor